MLYKNKKILWLFLLPAFLFMLVFLYYPFFVNIYNSFFDLSGLVQIQSPSFIGLENYQYLFSDDKFKTALLNSMFMVVLTVIFQVGFALLLAVLAESITKGQKFFRTAFFFPIVISATAIGLIFTLFYRYEGGALNQILALFGLEKVHWLSEQMAFIMVCIPVLWQYIGFYFVIFTTAINDIPPEIHEAAEIDGATGFKKTFSITLPMMKNVIFSCIILAVTGALKVFDLPWVIAPKGAPGGYTHFLGTYMYESAFTTGNMDYGCTIAVIIVLLGVILAQLLNHILRERDA